MKASRITYQSKMKMLRKYYKNELKVLIFLQSVIYLTYSASCEISIADFPLRAEEILQALVS